MSGSKRGIQRERQVRKQLEAADWWVCRAAGSLGDADLVAMKRGKPSRLIEVKSTGAGPYHSFGPKCRADLRFAAEMADAEAWLVWWPAYAQPTWIPAHAWPKNLEVIDA